MQENSYSSFAELKEYEIENSDYCITVLHRNPEIAVMAIHGGNIEPGTSEISFTLGERLNASTYLFEGLKLRDNGKLHITSTAFDEPTAILVANDAKTILSIHGYSDSHEELVYIGGKNDTFKKLIEIALREAGFQTGDAPMHLLGMSSFNIVNRCQTYEGVQLELSTKLRKRFFKDDDFTRKNRHNHTQLLYQFVSAIEKATIDYKQK
ncbi:poly-gamma-glutamate hydrolase family protein [Peribacillus sp. NPDC097206]|uniref:poly-gamma-glutamate hydrolase family protein n=1 Tax=unclassified Peribacillus TaxID=2675266 RepID=UPI0038277DF3